MMLLFWNAITEEREEKNETAKKFEIQPFFRAITV